MNAIDVLMNEHRNIKKLVDCARALCMELMEGKPVPTKELYTLIELVRNYADKHHHGKEEAILFREMQKLSNPQVQNIIQFGMLFDHDQGRMHILELQMALKNYEKAPSLRGKLDILSHASAWANVLEKHMVKEDNAVYKLAGVLLAPEVLQEIEKESVAFEEEHSETREVNLAKLDTLCTRCGFPA